MYIADFCRAAWKPTNKVIPLSLKENHSKNQTIDIIETFRVPEELSRFKKRNCSKLQKENILKGDSLLDQVNFLRLAKCPSEVGGSQGCKFD